MTKNALRIAAAALLSLAGTVVHAQTSFNSTVTTSSPTFVVASTPLGGVVGCGIQTGTHRYETQTFVATSTGAHSVTTTALSGFANDNFIALYQGVFDPNAPTANLVGCDDDSGPGLWSQFSSGLTTGQSYTVVFTSFRSTAAGDASTTGTGTFEINPSVSLAYSVGGAVTGLTGGTVVLRNNGGADLSVSADGTFVFGTALADSAPYAVTVFTQPAGQTCSVTNGSGTIAGGNVTNVTVTCAASAAPPPVVGIPTMSEWALLLLSAMLAFFAWRSGHPRNR